MGKVIILEGPDGGGKTTLARQLEKKGWVYKHEGPPPPGRDQIAYYLERLNESIESTDNVVHDRLWLGERIYGRVARNDDTLGEEGQRLFMRLHYSKQIRQYICLPPIDVARQNYKDKMNHPNDYLHSVEKFVKIFTQYTQWLYMNGVSADLFDYRMSSVNDVLDRGFFDTPLPRGTVGYPFATHLFIGDKPNHPTIDVPFHALNGSSGYFNQAVKFAGIGELDLAISNARDPNENMHDAFHIINSLPRVKHIFLMGAVAQKWWEFYGPKIRLRITTHHIEHPSYLKRFYGNNPHLMAEKIRGCLNGDPNQG